MCRGSCGTWEVKSCCCSCRPSLRSQDRTVLSRPPVHSLVPSLEMSIQLAPSVWPWNCLQEIRRKKKVLIKSKNGARRDNSRRKESFFTASLSRPWGCENVHRTTPPVQTRVWWAATEWLPHHLPATGELVSDTVRWWSDERLNLKTYTHTLTLALVTHG